jgi:hypothetical protein
MNALITPKIAAAGRRGATQADVVQQPGRGCQRHGIDQQLDQDSDHEADGATGSGLTITPGVARYSAKFNNLCRPACGLLVAQEWLLFVSGADP